MKTRKKRILNTEEIGRLLVHFHKNVRNYCLVSFPLNTGLRVGELVGLNVGDVQECNIIYIVGKGDKYRFIPLNEQMRELVAEFLHWKKRTHQDVTPDAPLFVSRQHCRLSIRSVQDLLDKAARRVGIGGGKVTPHTLRRTFATRVHRVSGIFAAKELLGHARSSDSTMYLVREKIDLRDTVQQAALLTD